MPVEDAKYGGTLDQRMMDEMRLLNVVSFTAGVVTWEEVPSEKMH